MGLMRREKESESWSYRWGVGVGGLNSGYKALFSACLQVLPSNKEETDRGKRAGEHISLYLLHSFSFCSWPNPLPKSQHRHAHTNKDTLSVSLSLRLCHTHTHTHTLQKPCPSLAVRMAAVLLSGRRRGKGGQGEAGGEKRNREGKKTWKRKKYSEILL